MDSVQTSTPSFGAAMTPLESRSGRFLRAPDEHPGTQIAGSGVTQVPQAPPQNDGGTGTGGDSTGGTNNSGGNSGTQNGNTGTQNNPGQPSVTDDFWSRSVSSGDGPPVARPGSDGTNPNGTGSDPNEQFSKELGQELAGLTFKPAMTTEIASDISEGKFESFDKLMAENHQAAVRNALQLSVKVIQRFGEQMMAQVEKRIGSSLTTKDNMSALETAFPIAKDPKIRPIVQSIFDRSLELNGNNREAALKMTRDMLGTMHASIGGDNGLNIPPPNPSDGLSQPNSPTNWLETLTAR
jgi:hypothetical protein